MSVYPSTIAASIFMTRGPNAKTTVAAINNHDNHIESFAM
jgi:hypothetical protein